MVLALVLATFSGGVWMVGLVWEVIRIGGGPGQLSLVSTSSATGIVAMSLLGGVIADRAPQKLIVTTVAVVELVAMAVIFVVSLAGETRLWHLCAAAGLIGVTSAFYFPAYSAWLPALVPANELLAANGLEGMVRPVVGQALGPAVAGIVVGAHSPSFAFAIASCAYLVGTAVLVTVPHRIEGSFSGAVVERMTPRPSVWADLREGVVFVARTRWLLVTLLFASVMILCTVGPLEVLIPFLVKNRLHGGAEATAAVMAAFGLGAALGSAITASLPLPRRYLTASTLMWGLGCLPLAVMGVAQHLVVLIGCALVLGGLAASAMVIWGTLLQRRVPGEFLGRVSSLDFFVSLSLAPVSMALVAPASSAIGIQNTFLVAGTVPALAAILVLLLAGFRRDELANPVEA